MRLRHRPELKLPLGCFLVCQLYVTAAHSADARELYRLGLEFYDEREYEAALEKFDESFQTQTSPNSKLYVARCLRSLGQTNRAIVAYEQAIQLASARIAAEPKYEQTYLNAMRELAVLKPPPPAAQRFVPATITAAGVGAAGLVSFGVFGSLARSRYSSLQNHCSPLPCPESETGHVESGRDYQWVANVSLAVGITGAIAAVTLYVLGRPRLSRYGQLEVSGNALSFSGEF